VGEVAGVVVVGVVYAWGWAVVSAVLVGGVGVVRVISIAEAVCGLDGCGAGACGGCGSGRGGAGGHRLRAVEAARVRH